jgi:Spy/CpxP family protein refolding chaperone
MKKILASLILLCGIIVLSQPANAQEEPKGQQDNQRPKLSPEERAGKRAAMFKEKLGLDDKQTASMKALLLEREKSSDKLREQLKKERDDFEAQTKKILTADQFQKLKDLQDDRKDRRQDMRKGTPPPPPAPEEKQ